ncbi:glycosyltransferase family 4 protein [Candidatus Poribacteria bacterium]|nr:glycosyltransferase family 4 protein [Candidatus Poribacteria bacterium]
MSEQLRILHVMASHRWTGAAEPAARVAAGQSRAGHTVLFAMTAGSSFEKETRKLGVDVTGAVRFERSYWPHRKLQDLRDLRRLIAGFRPDVVHAHLTHDHILAGAALGVMRAGKPVLVRTSHREEPPRSDAFTRALVTKRTAGLIAASRQLSEQLIAAYDLDPARVAHIGGSIDTERFRPSDCGTAMRERWGIPPNARVAGLVSRLRAERGLDWLIEAAESFLPHNGDARLVICGRGKYKQKLLERIAMHPARAQIVYAGYVEGSDLDDAYNAFDIALMLKPGNDGGCRSALEAMATGKAIIGGDVGAIRDLLAAGTTGWLVRLEDRQALAEAVSYALAQPDECSARGGKARDVILREHSEEAIAGQTIGLYRRALERVRRGTPEQLRP